MIKDSTAIWERVVFAIICLLFILAILVITSSAMAEVYRETRVSPGGKTYTLIFLTWDEFDDLVLSYGYNNRTHRETDGYIIAGLTVTLKRCRGWGCKPKAVAWKVYLPVNDFNQYEQDHLDHEVYYHVDREVNHPMPKD